MKTRGTAVSRSRVARRLAPQRGWTLIELGVVMLIIGIVVGVAAPRLSSMSETGRLSALEEEMLNLADSLDAYKRGGGLITTGNRRTVQVMLPVQGPNLGIGSADGVDSEPAIKFGLANFSGISPLKSNYTMQITASGRNGTEADRHLIHVATCIPADQNEIAFDNPFMVLDCADAACPGCLVKYERSVVPKKELTDIEAENELIYGTLPAPPPPPPPPPPGKCASPDTPIATPTGEVRMDSLREGDLVLSLVDDALVAVPLQRVHRTAVAGHTILRLRFADGRHLEMSPAHPTSTGVPFERLVVGTMLGDQSVVAIERRPYEHAFTYDILPDSASGTYVAAGALVGSTLRE